MHILVTDLVRNKYTRRLKSCARVLPCLAASYLYFSNGLLMKGDGKKGELESMAMMLFRSLLMLPPFLRLAPLAPLARFA